MSNDSRHVILQEAEYLIRTRGYAACAFAGLAARAGMRRRT